MTKPITAKLDKLIAEAQQAGQEGRGAQQGVQAAQAEVARLRNAAVEAIAENPKGVKAAKDAYRQAEVALDEAQMEAEGRALMATRARDGVDGFMRTHADALIEELGPEAADVVAGLTEWTVRGVELDAAWSDISARANRYVTASGHDPQGNMAMGHGLAEAVVQARHVADGLREIASPLPTWAKRQAREEHHRAQEERQRQREEPVEEAA